MRNGRKIKQWTAFTPVMVMILGCAVGPDGRPATLVRSEVDTRFNVETHPKSTRVSVLPDQSMSMSDPMSELAGTQELSLESLQDIALDNNPSLRQVEAAVRRAAGIQHQVGLNPNPRLGYFADEVGDNASSGLQGAFISQTFIRGDKLTANRHVLAHDLELMKWHAEAQRVRVLTDVEVNFYRVLAAQRRLTLAREFREVAVQGLSVAQDRLEAGGTRQDVLQSEIQLSEVDLLIQRTELEVSAAWKQLAAIAGVPEMTRSTLIGDLPTSQVSRSSESVYQQVLEESPALRAANQRLYRAQSNLRRQQVQPISNVTGQMGVGHDHSTGDEFINLQISLPLPVNNTNQGNIHAAKATVDEAVENLERLKMQIRSELAEVMREYEIAITTREQYEAIILPKAKESERLIAETYATGEVDFLRVLTARKMYFDANLEYVNAQGDQAVANARIEGFLLSGGLSEVPTFPADDSLRGQALSSQ